VSVLDRWVTREEIVEHFPISASMLARIPRALLDFGYVGKNAVYDVLDVDALFERLKGTSLKALIESLAPSAPESQAASEGHVPSFVPPGRKLRGKGRPRKAEATR